MNSVDVSVVVPTRNRAASLERFLRSLDSMEIPNGVRVEVLIVNNGSTDGTESLLRKEQSKTRKVSLGILSEQARGKANAVNRGLIRSAGGLILVVDDDVVVDRQWLAGHLECYGAISFDAVQGRVLPGVDPEGRPADLRRLYEYNIPFVDYGDQAREIEGLLATNISLKREVLQKVGLYDPRLGAGASGFGEDTEYSRRIGKAGFKIGYAPHAVVYHELNPERYGRVYNRQIHYRKGLSRSLYRRESVLFHAVPNLLANCVRFGLYRALGKEGKAYKAEGRIMRYWGYLLGRLRSIARAGLASDD